jgi:GT2 family glycosyltransferase
VRLSIVIVCFGEDLSRLLDAVHEQRAPGDEVIVVDNLATAGGTAGVREHPAVDRVVDSPGNLGFPPAVNLGAAVAQGDALVLLNPDAIPAPGCLDALRDPPPSYDAWMGVVTLPGGDRINTAGGESHFLGFSWVGGLGDPVSALPREPYRTGFVSGACMGVRLPVWRELGGFPDHFFLYFDDVDICHRLRLAGRDFGVVPAARVEHDYVFDKGARKWRNLERNRWATVIRTYPAPLLALVLPALVLAEAGLLAVALKGGWATAKLRSWADVVRWLPRSGPERRRIQATATVPVRAFAEALTPRLNSPLFGAVGRSPLVAAALGAYWRAVLALLPASS